MLWPGRWLAMTHRRFPLRRRPTPLVLLFPHLLALLCHLLLIMLFLLFKRLALRLSLLLNPDRWMVIARRRSPLRRRIALTHLALLCLHIIAFLRHLFLVLLSLLLERFALRLPLLLNPDRWLAITRRRSPLLRRIALTHLVLLRLLLLLNPCWWLTIIRRRPPLRRITLTHLVLLCLHLLSLLSHLLLLLTPFLLEGFVSGFPLLY